jgi:tetratricopeptide (TPR) repeat protein
MKLIPPRCSFLIPTCGPVHFLVVLVIGVGVSLLAAPLPQNEAKEQDILDRAQQAQRAGDYAGAANGYGAFLKLHPDVPEIQSNLGLMEFMSGRYSDAKGNFVAALRAKPDLLSANLFLGLDLLKLHEPQEALGHLQIADRRQPGNQTVLLGLGEAYLDMRQLEKASETYEAVVRAHPRNIDSLYGLGTTSLSLQEETAEKLALLKNTAPYREILLAEAFTLQQRPRDAIHIYEKLLPSYSNFEGLETGLGLADLQLGLWQAASDAFLAERKTRPHYLPALLGSAGLELLHGSLEKGLTEVGEIRAADANFLTFHAEKLWSALTPEQISNLRMKLKAVSGSSPNPNSAEFLLQSIDSAGAIPLSGAAGPARQESVDQDPKATPAKLYAGGHYTSCMEGLKADGNKDKARLSLLMPCSYYAGFYWDTFTSANSLLAREPENVAALFWRSKATLKLALGALTQAGLIDPNAYRVHLLTAETYGVMKRYEESEAEYKKAIQLRPEDPAAHLGLGTVYWRQMNFRAAQPELSLVLAANPSDAQASYMLGNILVTRHQFAQAEPLLKTGTHAPGEVGLRAHESLGKTFFSLGQTQDAIAELRQALPADRDGSVYFQLYLAYKKAGDTKSAAAALQQSESIRKARIEREADNLEVLQ